MSNVSSMTVEEWALDRFRPYERNPRRNEAAVDQMVGSIREFGFKIPILARSTGDVVDGHLRLKAARALSLKTLPVILCDEWSVAQVKAFRLMVNRSATWADWNEDLLGKELDDLAAMNFDLTLTGFDEDEIARYLKTGEKSADFGEYDETINTDYECPKCGYRWSGKSAADPAGDE